MRLVAVAVALVVALCAPPVRAEGAKAQVALLPLDADASLEIYGQPVASEIAKTLAAAGIDVVVVGPRMAVPTNAMLIIDGKIAAKGQGIALSLRVRDQGGHTYDPPLQASALALTNIDTAATELAQKLLPAVKDDLVEAAKRAREADRMPPPNPPNHTGNPVPARLAVALVATHASSPAVEPLRAALAAQVEPWARRYHHATAIDDKVTEVAKGVAAHNAELGVGLEVMAYTLVGDPLSVPMVTARVHVVVANPREVLFDRIIVTDTVVGDKNSTPDQLAARAAREVLTILAPHVGRSVTTWVR